MMKSAAAQVEEQPAASPLSLEREQAWLVQAAVAHITGVALKDLCATTRRPPKVAFARQIAMYLSHIVFEMNQRQVARAFGRDRSTAAHAIRHIEELREDPEVDRMLGLLEALLMRAEELS
jgi:chromosomal replication initiation ATPase DnaA